MKFERRVRKLERTLGVAIDDSFCSRLARLHARGEKVPRIIVQPGETVEEVRRREGIPDDYPVVARIIVEPSGWRAETDAERRQALRRGSREVR